MDTNKTPDADAQRAKPDRSTPIPLSDRRRLSWQAKDKDKTAMVFSDWASI